MNETVILVLAWGAGILLGAFFFGGLWWTVRKSVLSGHPATWILSSLLLRTGVTLAGFYFISDGHWKRLLVCLFGFVLTRFFVTRITGPSVQHNNSLSKEVRHAP